MIEIPTRKAAAATLEKAGITGLAADLLLRESAPTRHAARVLATLAAACLADLDGDPDFAVPAAEGAARALMAWATAGGLGPVPDHALSENDLCEAWAMLSLDLGGVGGHGGYSGDGTARHPLFTRVGKGRKHASDGGAWLSAAKEAQGILAGALATLDRTNVRFAARRPTPLPGETIEDQAWLLVVAWDTTNPDVEPWSGVSRNRGPGAAPRRLDLAWQQAEVARQLLAAATADPVNLAVAAPWAKLYNELTSEIFAAQAKADAADAASYAAVEVAP